MVKIPIVVPQSQLLPLFGRPDETTYHARTRTPTTMTWLFTDQKGMSKVVAKELCERVQLPYFSVLIHRIALRYRVRTWTLTIWVLAERFNERNNVLTPSLAASHAIFFRDDEIESAWRAANSPTALPPPPPSEDFLQRTRRFFDDLVARRFGGDWEAFTRATGQVRI